MGLRGLWDWLHQKAPELSEEEQIANLMREICGSDPEIVNPAFRHLLRILYNNHNDYSPRFVHAVLEALGRQEGLHGIDEILRGVGYLAFPPSHFLTGSDLNRAAQQCLIRLRERYQEGYAAQSLLHPSIAPTADNLLRPADATGATSPETLLRPADAAQERKPSL